MTIFEKMLVRAGSGAVFVDFSAVRALRDRISARLDLFVAEVTWSRLWEDIDIPGNVTYSTTRDTLFREGRIFLDRVPDYRDAMRRIARAPVPEIGNLLSLEREVERDLARFRQLVRDMEYMFLICSGEAVMFDGNPGRGIVSGAGRKGKSVFRGLLALLGKTFI